MYSANYVNTKSSRQGIISKFKFRKGKSILTIWVPMKCKMHRSENSSQTIKTMLVGLSSNVGRLSTREHDQKLLRGNSFQSF